MSYVLEPSYTDVPPDTIEYNNINIKFKELYSEIKNNIDKHLDSRLSYWSSMETKYNIDEPGIMAPSPNRNPDDSSDDESEEINWPKQVWALYLTSIKIYKNPSGKNELNMIDLKFSESEYSDFDLIYGEIMESSFSAKQIYNEVGY